MLLGQNWRDKKMVLPLLHDVLCDLHHNHMMVGNLSKVWDVIFFSQIRKWQVIPIYAGIWEKIELTCVSYSRVKHYVEAIDRWFVGSHIPTSLE